MAKEGDRRMQALVEAGIGTAEAVKLATLIRWRLERGISLEAPLSEAEEVLSGTIGEDLCTAMASWYSGEIEKEIRDKEDPPCGKE